MNHRIIAGVLLGVSLIGIGVSYLLLRHPDLVGLCPVGFETNCLDGFLLFGVAKPFYWGTRFLPLIFLVLIFVRKEVFNAWWKVFLPFFLVAFFFILTAEPLGSLLWPDRTFMTERMVQILVGISALVIVWKYWRLSKKKI